MRLISLLSTAFLLLCSLQLAAQTDPQDALAIQKLHGLLQSECPSGTDPATMGEEAIQTKRGTVTVGQEVKQSSQQGALWLYSCAYHIRIDGKNRKEFSTVSVGLGKNETEARQNSIREWISYFGVAFSDWVYERNSIDLGSYQVYTGLMRLRGGQPGDWVLGDRGYHEDLLANIDPVLERKLKKGLSGLDMKINVQPSGAISGECLLSGKRSTAVLSELLEMPWPSNKSYLLRQFYLLDRVKK